MLKRSGKVVALLFLAVLVLGASDAKAADTQKYTYCYQLEQDTAARAGQSAFKLYVARAGESAPALHGGSVSLGVPLAENADQLSFALENVWQLLPQGLTPIDLTRANVLFDSGKTVIQTGSTTEEPMPYLSFTWGAKEGVDIAPPDTPDTPDTRQLIGTFAVAVENLTVDDVFLVPFPETQAGAQMLKDWKDAVDKPPYLELIEAVWRMDDNDRPSSGFYQGYGSPLDEDPELEVQRAFDITNGWQSFCVQSYNPFKAVTIEVYTKDAPNTRVASMTTTPTALDAPDVRTGRVSILPDLTAWKGNDGASVTLPVGTYEIVVKKPSHVSVRYTGLTVTQTDLFPELKGVLCYLPCGDLSGDNQIRMFDRAKLTAHTIYGKVAPAGKTDVSDLDGDGRVGQRDLAILIDPANYGKSAKTIAFGGTEGVTP